MPLIWASFSDLILMRSLKHHCTCMSVVLHHHADFHPCINQLNVTVQYMYCNYLSFYPP